MEHHIFKDSAFKHGYAKKDFDALMHRPKLVLRSRRGFQNVYEIMGRNDDGDYLHIITRRYRKGDDKIIIVFHIDRMNTADRKRFIKFTGKL